MVVDWVAVVVVAGGDAVVGYDVAEADRFVGVVVIPCALCVVVVAEWLGNAVGVAGVGGVGDGAVVVAIDVGVGRATASVR